MKTLKEAAFGYAVSREVDANELKYVKNYAKAFISGFEFANELIESEVNLPEKFTRVLVKFEPYDKKLFEICVIHEFSDGYKMWLSDSGLYYKIKDTKWKYLNY